MDYWVITHDSSGFTGLHSGISLTLGFTISISQSDWALQFSNSLGLHLQFSLSTGIGFNLISLALALGVAGVDELIFQAFFLVGIGVDD